MLLQVHDELVLEVPDDEIEIIRPLVENTMSEAANLFDPERVKFSIPLVVESDFSRTWEK